MDEMRNFYRPIPSRNVKAFFLHFPVYVYTFYLFITFFFFLSLSFRLSNSEYWLKTFLEIYWEFTAGFFFYLHIRILLNVYVRKVKQLGHRNALSGTPFAAMK